MRVNLKKKRRVYITVSDSYWLMDLLHGEQVRPLRNAIEAASFARQNEDDVELEERTVEIVVIDEGELEDG